MGIGSTPGRRMPDLGTNKAQAVVVAQGRWEGAIMHWGLDLGSRDGSDNAIRHGQPR
jgi:hypothetical protein